MKYTTTDHNTVRSVPNAFRTSRRLRLKNSMHLVWGVCIFLFGAGLFSSLPVSGASAPELDVKPEIGIRILENNPTTRFAAQELARYLAIMSNNTGIAEIEVFGEKTWPEDKPLLTLGLLDDFSVKMNGITDPSTDDAICVQVKDSKGFIAGSNPRSILFAMYRFLEANGCLWIRPGLNGDYVPSCDVLKLSANISDKAFYHFRGFSNCGGHTCDDMIDRIAWMPKVGLNTFFHEFMLPRMQYDIYLKHGYPSLKAPENRTDEEIRAYFELSIREAKKRGLSYHAAGHGWTAIVAGAPESQSDHFARPEPQSDKVKYLAQIKGSRNLKEGPSFTDICHGNPEAQKRFARCVADYAENHPEVDYLHVWLDDRSNDTCECERCIDPVIADAYVRLLNLIDEELTRRKIDMKIVFIAYHETMWRPVHERFKRMDRFSMLFAPISRNYNEPYPTKAPDVDVKPYVKNKYTAPTDVATNVGMLKRWQEIFPKKAFVYEYHMWQHHYTDLGYFEFARVMGEDIKRMRYIGLDGFVSCMVGRANFPHGFPMNVHARLLWNPDQDFDKLADEYFRGAFGKDYRLALDYVRKLSANSVYTLKVPTKEQKKEFVEKLSAAGPVFDAFRPVIAQHVSEDLPAAVHDSWKYLLLHNEIYSLYAKALLAQAQGKSAEEIQKQWQAMVNKIAWTEDETRPVFDLFKFYSRLYTAKKLKPVPKPEYSVKVPVLETVLELNIGQTETVTLTDGSRVTAKLVSIKEILDPAVKALRQAQVALEINGKPLTLVSGTYRRPVTFDNVQIDVPVVLHYVQRSGKNAWGIAKDARLRMWPKNSPLTHPGTFVYPIKQKLFATSTQMNNEPVFVDGGERPGSKTQYYHSGLDFGGCEGEIEVVAAADSIVVSSGLKFAPGHEGTPVSPRYDVIYALDGRGWYYRYSHLKRIDVHVGDVIKAGQTIGILGKEAGSGGWSHLHFGVSSNVPNGQWGDLQSYPFVWEAYVNQFKPKVIACTRPHIVGVVGRDVELNGELSWSADGNIVAYEWTCSNGKVVHGPKAKIIYAKPGYYSEVLKVVDAQGNISFDTVQVEIFDDAMVNKPVKSSFDFPASIHLTYAPTCDIKVGEPVTFKVRSFRTKEGGETIDFGDGTPKVQLKSDGNARSLNPNGYAVCTHAFTKPGTYWVRADHVNSNGLTATTRVFVTVK